MLKGISPAISPELLKVLSDMGHGDEIVFADAHFPGHSMNSRVLRADGVGVDTLLKGLIPLADDDEFVKKFAAVKQANKVDFSNFAKRKYGFDIDPNTMINTMVKRLHEYKRQALKILSVIADYADIKSGKVSADDIMPRTIVFGAKAAPGYYLAKQTIQLINNVARVINNDPDVKGKLNVYFPWNYNIELAMNLIPATDLDEQISQAGKEASGTGNMKFALNGALTVGTLDGANVEIRERVGAENFFLFGMTVDEAEARRNVQNHAAAAIAADPRLGRAVAAIRSGVFSAGEPDRYAGIVDNLTGADYFLVASDFTDYWRAQREVDRAYLDRNNWARMAALNVARSGWFSSDRTIRGYMADVWHAKSLLGQE
jgi:starch phosphorylase